MSNAAPQTGEPTMEEILASIRRIISEEEGDPAAAKDADPMPVTPEPVAALPPEDDDVLELTQVVPEPEPAPAQRPRPVLVEPDNDIAFDATPAMEPRRMPEPEIDEGLVADEVIERAGAAFDRLHRDTALTETVAGNSIEGLVRHILRPLLKQWLDEHLPDIVESIVREEVARAASRRR